MDEPQQPKSRIRFSLLNLLLMATIVALALSLWQAHQKLQPLEERVLELRREAGIVDAPDPKKLYVRKLKHSVDPKQHFRWRAYVPHGESAKIRLRVGPAGKQSSGTIALSSGETSFDLVTRGTYFALRMIGEDTGGECVFSVPYSFPVDDESSAGQLDRSKGASFGETLILLNRNGTTDDGVSYQFVIQAELLESKRK